MSSNYAWGSDLISLDNVGLEAFKSEGPNPVPQSHPNFKPINIVIENGIYYTTLYVCCITPRSEACQKLMMWFASLRSTDYVKLSVASLLTDIPVVYYLPILGALVRSKATIEIQLDTIVCDTLAYFYLAADKIKLGSSGALLIPSYADAPTDTKSTPWKVVNDFITYLVNEGEHTGVLTQDDVERLHDGKSVIVHPDRFKAS